jgi:putative SbcD/Mre11-related phosphoesterase
MKFIPNKPALLINGALVVADLHNGIEFELFKKGANVPSQTGKKLERLKEIIKETRPKKLVILGDFKHNVPITSRQEEREVPLFLQELLKLVPKVIITKGNHDGNIERLVPPGVEVVDEFVEKGVGYFHGHKKPSAELLKQKLIICAHTHPSVMLRDIRGNIQPAWIETKVKGSETEALIVPAFDDTTRGSSMNYSEPLGPFLKKMIDLENAEVYLLDGSYLGSLGDLKPMK